MPEVDAPKSNSAEQEFDLSSALGRMQHFEAVWNQENPLEDDAVKRSEQRDETTTLLELQERYRQLFDEKDFT